MIDCQLCKGEKVTRRYYEDDIYWIADCMDCKVPMAVLKAHRKPIKDELEQMIEKARELFDMETNVFDFNMSKIPNHFHFHIRKFKR